MLIFVIFFLFFFFILEALVVLGFEQKEVVSVWRVVAAVLHLGNVVRDLLLQIPKHMA